MVVSEIMCFISRYGFVTFNTYENVQKALDDNKDLYILGRPIKLNREQPFEPKNTTVSGNRSGGGDEQPTQRLLIRNISYNTTVEKIHKFFPTAMTADLAIQPKSGTSKGYVPSN